MDYHEKSLTKSKARYCSNCLPWLPLGHIFNSKCINWCKWRSPITRRCFRIDLYQFGILNMLLYRFLWIFLQFGGHLGNMQIRLWRRHFSACQHWFLDSAYQNTPNRHLKTFSSQNACTFLNKRLFLIFFPDYIHVLKHNICKMNKMYFPKGSWLLFIFLFESPRNQLMNIITISNTENTHVFHALTNFAWSRGSCLNTRPLGQVFKHLLGTQQVLMPSNNHVWSLFLYVLRYSNKTLTENTANTLKYHLFLIFSPYKMASVLNFRKSYRRLST